MCGLVGIFGAVRRGIAKDVAAMSKSLGHRGPDDRGVWVDINAGIGLAHVRLAVLDLTPAGHQPMISHSGRYVTVFNGEIYNHLDLRKELEMAGSAPPWNGNSDTETWLAAVECWGLESALTKSVGMFAIAVWDNQTKTLFLARDRMGEKPLYYGWIGREFVFGSELKAFRELENFDGSVSRPALALYMRYASVPAPHSIYKGIYKLEPGCFLSVAGVETHEPNIPLRAPADFGSLRLRRWWDLAQVQLSGSENLIADDDAAISALEAVLVGSIDSQSLADVPVGAFLSGGVDSSLVVALMQQRASRPIKTFTVGFEEPDFDESSYARAVATHLGTEHTELTVTATDAMSLIGQLPAVYDEPFADASQIPTFFVCRAARRKVTVSLSGDGGDELFGGYDHYLRGPKIWSNLKYAPYKFRRGLGYAINAMPASALEYIGNTLNSVLPPKKRVDRLTNKIMTAGALLYDSYSIETFHLSLVSKWRSPDTLVLGVPKPNLTELIHRSRLSTNCELSMMFRDSIDYLPNSILCKVDRAAMANSLETRTPFLDHRLVEIAWRLPLNMKIRAGQTKWALRQVLYKYVPKSLIERPKAGFGIPLGDWLRGPLRQWADDLLDESLLKSGGFLSPDPICKQWKEHLKGNSDNSTRLWTVLMFQAWLEREKTWNKRL